MYSPKLVRLLPHELVRFLGVLSLVPPLSLLASLEESSSSVKLCRLDILCLTLSRIGYYSLGVCVSMLSFNMKSPHDKM